MLVCALLPISRRLTCYLYKGLREGRKRGAVNGVFLGWGGICLALHASQKGESKTVPARCLHLLFTCCNCATKCCCVLFVCLFSPIIAAAQVA